MPGGVIDGQSVNAAITNAAFLFQNGPSTGVGILGLAEAASSGPAIENVQATINVLIDGVGGTQYDPATSYAGVPGNTITSGNTHQEALIELANLFGASGHNHDGSSGSGGQISYNSLAGIQLQGFALHAMPATSVSGASSDVTSLLIGNYNSWNQAVTGVVTNSPYNYIHIFDQNGDSYLDSLGNKVYGRLTCDPVSGFSPPTAWTLSYYSNQSSIETSYSMAASSYVDWYFQFLFTEPTRPVYSDAFVIVSDQVAGEIPNATTGLKGKVNLATSAQSVGSANNAGTANATVANADHVHQGIHSFAASGSSALYGDVTISASGAAYLEQSGQNVIIYSPASGAAVNSLAASGQSPLTGIVTLSASGAASLTQSGQNISIYAPASGAAVNSIAASGQAALTGAVTIAASGGIVLGESGQTITIYAPTSSPIPGLPDVLAVNNSASAGINMSGGALVSIAYEDFIQTATPAFSPASGHEYLYAKSDGLFYKKLSSGTEQVIETSLAASGQSALRGDVVLAASGGIVLGESGQTITIYAPTTATPASGTAVTSLAASGQTALTGAVVIAASGGVVLEETGQTITIYAPTATAPASGTAVTSLAASGQAALTGSVTLAASGGIVLGESGQTITIYAPTSSPVPGLPDVLAVNNSASAGINMSGGALVSIAYEDFILTSTPPFSPASGHGFLYEKTDGRFYRKSSAGVETEIETTLAASGQSALRGDVTLSASGGIVLTQSGQNISIYAPTGGGVGAGIVVLGTRASPKNITASGFSVALGNMSSTVATFQKIYVQGSGGPIDITANPQIEAGIFDGQQLQIVGRSGTNTVLLENGNGLSLNGNASLAEDFTITLSWDSVNWVEVNRNF